MRNTFFCFLVLFIFNVCGQAQNSAQIFDSIVHAFKRYDVDKANVFTDKLVDQNMRQVFLFQSDYYKFGDLNFPLLRDDVFNDSKRRKIVLYYLQGDYYRNVKSNANDSLSYENYLQAFTEAQTLNDTLLINECLPRILNHHFRYKNTNLIELNNYSGLLGRYSRDSIDYFWYRYYLIVSRLAEFEQKQKNYDLDTLFEACHMYAKNIPFLKGKIHQLEGVYKNHFLKDHERAKYHFNESKNSYRKDGNYVSLRRLSGNQINLAIYNYDSKNYMEAIAILKQALSNDFSDNNKDEEYRANEWMSKSYEGLKKFDSAYFYLKKMIKLQGEMDRLNYAKDTKDSERRKELKDTKSRLTNVITENKKLQINLWGLVPILGIVILVLLVVLVLYNRYRKRSLTLESEKSETLQKLDELKSIVIKNHIVLKDKTKIYIADLMYVKSDDHYLHVFTADHEKAHMVRGKLSQIKKELPPNFIQCHRSYIVNQNFIQQSYGNIIKLKNSDVEIPISRSYKDNFQ